MSFRVIQPPTEEAAFAEIGKKLVAASQKLGLNFDAEGFLFSWVQGTRVIIEENGDEIEGLALLTLGKRWTHNDTTATVLACEARDYDGMIEYLKMVSSAMGCTEMFIQLKIAERAGDNLNKYTILGHLLG